jgi:hypothetical protein
MENVMSKEAANADLAAAAFWKSVAISDKAETSVAVTKVREYTADARREEKEPSEGARRTRGLGAG